RTAQRDTREGNEEPPREAGRASSRICILTCLLCLSVLSVSLCALCLPCPGTDPSPLFLLQQLLPCLHDLTLDLFREHREQPGELDLHVDGAVAHVEARGDRLSERGCFQVEVVARPALVDLGEVLGALLLYPGETLL